MHGAFIRQGGQQSGSKAGSGSNKRKRRARGSERAQRKGQRRKIQQGSRSLFFQARAIVPPPFSRAFCYPLKPRVTAYLLNKTRSMTNDELLAWSITKCLHVLSYKPRSRNTHAHTLAHACMYVRTCT